MIDHSKSKNIFRAVEKYSLVPSPRARVDGDPDGAELSEPLLRGDLDAVIKDGDPRVFRLLARGHVGGRRQPRQRLRQAVGLVYEQFER